MDKVAVIDAFREQVTQHLVALARVTADARSEATGGESKAEGKYDTRAIEASYLAAGQGRRLDALKRLAAWLARAGAAERCSVVGEGALVGLADGRWLLVGPAGGARVSVGDQMVALISLQSPLGEELDGAEHGDVVELELPRGLVPVRVDSVS